MEEKSILDATEYILLALNNIKNFTEFNEYKEEIIKAIYDIRNSITNITNSKNIIQPNINEQIESNKNNSSISSMLGLKFNYDAYLKDFNINNYNNQISFSNSNGNFNYMKQNNINEYNDLNNMDENINDKKNSGLMSLKEENMNFEAQENKEDNIIYNKSIRNRFKGSKKNNGNANMNEIKNENKEKNRLINLKENSNDINKNIQADINPKKNKNLNSQYKKDKLSLIADIIMKINSEDEFYEILTKLFGNDLTDKLMSSDVSDELLEAVQNSIKEIEELKKKDNLNEENQKKEEINQEEIEEEPRKFPVNEIMGANVKDKNNKKFNKEVNNVYQEFDFKKNLIKNDNFEGKKKNKINNNGKKEKPFISATSAYGNYFDPPLQKGGISKLDDYKK